MFAAPEILKDKDGKNVNAGPPWKAPDKYEMDSLAAVPCVLDFDGDGDFDLLIGNIAGRVMYIPNEGTPTKPAFDASKRRAIQAGGKDLKVEGDAGPVAADWDGDGLVDLIVGAGDGSVRWFRNEGSKKEPAFAAGKDLIAKSKADWSKPVAHGAAPEGPGFRAKVGVADWNGDGRLDLLVGDFWQEAAAAKKLTKEEQDHLVELKKRYNEIQKIIGEAKTPEEQQKLNQEFSDVWKKMSELEPRPAPRGSVWLYLREPAKATDSR